MTRTRFLSVMLAAVCSAALLTFAGGSSAAPIPKGAGKGDETPNLKVFFETVGKAVKNEKWPAKEEEKLLRATAEKIFERMLKAAEVKERKLPVEFDKLKKLDVVKEMKGGILDGNFLIVGDVRTGLAKNSVIFASGNVQITSATNCIIIAQNVRCTGVNNCVVVAGDFIRLTSARQRNGEDGSVLVAGQWIRVTGSSGAICHVIRPGMAAPPDEKFPDPMSPPIRMTGAEGVIFLNSADHWKTTSNKNCVTIELKTPIAK
ncbi:MAG: hypothetical protein L0241_06815 [Planctomycetia bacterium]|nr:hypothetical protein [Planctomycetia bacterium]